MENLFPTLKGEFESNTSGLCRKDMLLKGIGKVGRDDKYLYICIDDEYFRVPWNGAVFVGPYMELNMTTPNMTPVKTIPKNSNIDTGRVTPGRIYKKVFLDNVTFPSYYQETIAYVNRQLLNCTKIGHSSNSKFVYFFTTGNTVPGEYGMEQDDGSNLYRATGLYKIENYPFVIPYVSSNLGMPSDYANFTNKYVDDVVKIIVNKDENAAKNFIKNNSDKSEWFNAVGGYMYIEKHVEKTDSTLPNFNLGGNDDCYRMIVDNTVIKIPWGSIIWMDVSTPMMVLSGQPLADSMYNDKSVDADFVAINALSSTNGRNRYVWKSTYNCASVMNTPIRNYEYQELCLYKNGKVDESKKILFVDSKINQDNYFMTKYLEYAMLNYNNNIDLLFNGGRLIKPYVEYYHFDLNSIQKNEISLNLIKDNEFLDYNI